MHPPTHRNNHHAAKGKVCARVVILGHLVGFLLNPSAAGAAEAKARNGVWFADVRNQMTLSEADAEAVFRFSRRVLSRERTATPQLPGPLLKDRAPRIVFLSCSDGTASARVVIGTGRGFKAALDDALGQLEKRAGTQAPRWLKLDLVNRVGKSFSITPASSLSFNPSLQGIAFERRLGVALLPEQLTARMLVSSDKRLRIDPLTRYLGESGPQNSPALRIPASGPWTVHFFRSASFCHDGKATVALFRGHCFPRHIAREDMLDAARLGGAYLRQAVDARGRFAYMYYPGSDRVAASYNIVRHAGTVYAMFDLYQTTRDRELLRAAERASKFLQSRIQPYKNSKNMACLVEKGRIKLGAVALALVALAKQIEVTGDRSLLVMARRLASYIQHSQEASGQFISVRLHPSGRVKMFDSEYYPGEAILGLLRLYALDRQAAWLDTAAKGAHYLITVRDRDLATIRRIQDHWLLYGLNELYRFRKRDSYLRHAMRIASAIRGSQNRRPAAPDSLGSYGRSARSTPTATRSEGLLAAYQLARDFGTRKQARAIRDTIYLNLALQVQTQFRPESVLYLKRPARALGGFHDSLTGLSVRIDYVQHNISSLLTVYRILKADKRELLAPKDSVPARLLAKMRRRALP